MINKIIWFVSLEVNKIKIKKLNKNKFEGMFALGWMHNVTGGDDVGGSSGNAGEGSLRNRHWKIAEEITKTCYLTYKKNTETGLGFNFF
jgi:hypothetical protein